MRCYDREPPENSETLESTDIDLLGLARYAGGVLATFDRTIPLAAVKGATRAHGK